MLGSIIAYAVVDKKRGKIWKNTCRGTAFQMYYIYGSKLAAQKAAKELPESEVRKVELRWPKGKAQK